MGYPVQHLVQIKQFIDFFQYVLPYDSAKTEAWWLPSSQQYEEETDKGLVRKGHGGYQCILRGDSDASPAWNSDFRDLEMSEIWDPVSEGAKSGVEGP